MMITAKGVDEETDLLIEIYRCEYTKSESVKGVSFHDFILLDTKNSQIQIDEGEVSPVSTSFMDILTSSVWSRSDAVHPELKS